MRRLALLALAAGVLLAVFAPSAFGAVTTWHVKITNLQPGGEPGQTITPPVLIVHKAGPPPAPSIAGPLHVWKVGEKSSDRPLEPCAVQLVDVAEEAFNAAFVACYRAQKNVRAVYNFGDASCAPAPNCAGGAVPAGGIPPGASRELDISTKGGFTRLSWVSMFIPTNDAFGGVDAIRVRPVTKTTTAYDHGTEINNEDPAFIPGPPPLGFGNFWQRAATNVPVSLHPGIGPGGALADFSFASGETLASLEITAVP